MLHKIWTYEGDVCPRGCCSYNGNGLCPEKCSVHSFQAIANCLQQRMAYVPITGVENFAHTVQMESHSHMLVSSVLMIAGVVLGTKLYWCFSYFCTGPS